MPAARTRLRDDELLKDFQCAESGTLMLGFLVGTVCIGGFLFGYDTGVVSGAMILIREDFHLSNAEHELVVSSTIAFAIVGSLASGTLNRCLGRRPVLMAGSVIFTVGALAMAVANSTGTLVVGRCIVGIAVGFSSTTVPLYIAELAPPQQRGLLVALNNSCIVIGQVVASLVDGLFSTTPDGWRFMLGLGGVPSVIQFFGLLFLPESPRWLVTQGRPEAARAVLLKLRKGRAQLGDAAFESAVEGEILEITQGLEVENIAAPASRSIELPREVPAHTEMHTEMHTESADFEISSRDEAGSRPSGAAGGASAAAVAAKEPHGWKAVLSGGGGVSLAELWAVRRQLRLGVGILVLQQLIGINTIMYYSASILKASRIGDDQTVIWLSAAVAAAQLLGCLVGMLLIDRLGRRLLVLLSLGGVVFTLALEGAAFALAEWSCAPAAEAATLAAALALPPSAPAPSPLPSHPGACSLSSSLSLGAMTLYLLSFGVGMAPVPWAISAEIYPMKVRSACIAIGTAGNWTANVLVAATFLSLQEAVSRPGAFWVYGSCALAGLGWLGWCLPETKGKTLEQIQSLFLKEGGS